MVHPGLSRGGRKRREGRPSKLFENNLDALIQDSDALAETTEYWPEFMGDACARPRTPSATMLCKTTVVARFGFKCPDFGEVVSYTYMHGFTNDPTTSAVVTGAFLPPIQPYPTWSTP
jgi:hypothetical protein